MQQSVLSSCVLILLIFGLLRVLLEVLDEGILFHCLHQNLSSLSLSFSQEGRVNFLEPRQYVMNYDSKLFASFQRVGMNGEGSEQLGVSQLFEFFEITDVVNMQVESLKIFQSCQVMAERSQSVMRKVDPHEVADRAGENGGDELQEVLDVGQLVVSQEQGGGDGSNYLPHLLLFLLFFCDGFFLLALQVVVIVGLDCPYDLKLFVWLFMALLVRIGSHPLSRFTLGGRIHCQVFFWVQSGLVLLLEGKCGRESGGGQIFFKFYHRNVGTLKGPDVLEGKVEGWTIERL